MTRFFTSIALFVLAWFALPVAIVRGPFQQSQTSNEILVVCKTDVSATVALHVDGRDFSSTGTTHVFTVDGLDSGTSYPYTLDGWGSSVLETAPIDNRHFRFLAFGDSGNLSTAQFDVAARMISVPEVDFALGLGDLVYESGQASGFDPRLFQPYAGFMHRIPFWPTLGNHDAGTSNGAPFYEAFYLPTDSGAPGHPSNTERYYSFDYGSAHFICLDSESSSTSSSSAQSQWLIDDLQANQDDRWRFIFMHHPVYSHGSHNSDTESELITLRNNLVPIFDAWKVDMVLVGHSHNYERSYLVRESTIVQNDQDSYTKPPEGAIYVVSGCAGKISTSGSMDHPLMAFGVEGLAGFSLIDVTYDEIVGQFIDRNGNILEVFRVSKGQPPNPGNKSTKQRVASPTTTRNTEWSNGDWFVPNYGEGMWVNAQEISLLPVSGVAWDNLVDDADALGPINVGNQDEDDDSRAMAAALVWKRTGEESYRAAVQSALLGAIGTHTNASDSLSLSRNLCALAIAAELIDWSPNEAEAPFKTWLSDVRTYSVSGRTLISTHEDRPNNWHTHAGASRIAIDIYIDDQEDLAAAANVFHGWLGDRDSYAGFEYGDLCWQADSAQPVGINPVGAMLAGVNVDGVLPDDQRRSGLCPPSITCENYVWEALQGAVAEAHLLQRKGFDSWNWENKALMRAVVWLYDVANCSATGNDTWIPWIINATYGTSFSTITPTEHGRAVGWADWTHAIH